MYKVVSLILVFVILLSPVVSSADNDFSSQVNQLLVDFFKNLQKKDINGYVAKVESDKLYLNLGQSSNLQEGKKLLVVKPLDLLQDPVTRRDLARLNQRLALVTITQIKENYSVAEIDEKYSEEEITSGAKVINNGEQIKILLNKFNSSKVSNELATELEGRFYSYLTRHKLFKVNSVAIDNKQELTDLEQRANYLVTAEVYNGENKIFLKMELYNINKGMVTKERVISFANRDQIINYYKTKYKEEQLGYNLLFKTEKFSGAAHNLAWRGFEAEELLVNQESDLKIMSYDDELKTEETIDDYQRTKYDDYNLVIDTSDDDQNLGMIVENNNYPIQFKRNNGQYKLKVLSDFERNRPKAITNLADKKYLITRDYKSFLRFNFWEDDQFVTDFKIKVKENEGYRVGLAEVDDDKQPEMILTSYQGETGYKIKIYNLDSEIEAVLDQTVGPEFVTANLNNNKFPEIYCYDPKSNRVLAWEWSADEYQKIWQSEELSEDIVDLTIGDINQDGDNELLVLVSNDEQSRIYTYQFKLAD
ncbi:MAG: hypothetical protein ACQEP9_00650 [Bacillota bacterium]